MINLLSLLILPLLGTLNTQSFPEVLSREDELKYLKLWELKDEDARNKLIEHNLRLVAHIVKKFDNTREDKDDLLSVGAFGLIKAVDSYNFDSTTKLSTYAARCIENEILMYLRTTKRKRQTSWLYSTIGEDKDGNKISLYDIIEDEQQSALETLLNEEQKQKLLEALKVLTKREYDIICWRYGLLDHEVKTQREIAKILNISRSYVSRLEKRALSKLYLEIKR